MADEKSSLSESSKKEITALVQSLLAKFKADSTNTIDTIARRIQDLKREDEEKRLQ